MSVYNGGKYLGESIQSILGQTFSNFEFIIINDCSTDNSLTIINDYIKKDKRIVLINNSRNLGLTKSLNLGIKEARGKYIARIDSDDIALPNRLKTQYDFLEKNKDIFLVGSSSYTIDESGKVRTIKKVLTNVEYIRDKLSIQNCISHPTIMFKNEGFTYRENFVYSQDYDFYLILLSNHKKITNLVEPLIKYRISTNAISWSKKSAQNNFALRAKEFYHQRLVHGKDDYEHFNPDEILSIDVDGSTDEMILRAEIEAKFKLNEFNDVKSICTKYFKHYGFVNRITVYYLLSFMGKDIVNTLRCIIFR
jgi:glycosyltransferase involved in cell wall biosynthesis